MFQPMKPVKKARIGLYSVGLKAYWDQFEGLRERLIGYGNFIETNLSHFGEILNFGLVDDEESGRRAGEWFNAKNADIIFCHSATYITSASVLPVHQICSVPVVILNLQPTRQMKYEKTTTGEWLAHCGACPVPEIVNALSRANIRCRVINGLLGMDKTPEISLTDENTAEAKEAVRAWKEIEEWAQATAVKRTLRHSRFGFLGNNYSGMLDMYSDITMLQAQLGIHVELLEMCDLDRHLNLVTDADIKQKIRQVEEFFTISGDSPSDPIAKNPRPEQLDWSCRVAAAQERMVKEYRLDALAYYYHGTDNNHYEQVQGGFIVGYSLLTAQGIPSAGEGDLKTAVAMKICDILNKGGSFTEIVAMDYNHDTIILGHDGPFHISISDGKPVLRGMEVYHGKKGGGISVEANVISGPVTMLGLTQLGSGRLKLIASEGMAVKLPILTIGNTQTHVDFGMEPDAFMDEWFAQAPTHHWAMSVGHNASLFKKTAELLSIDFAVVGT